MTRLIDAERVQEAIDEHVGDNNPVAWAVTHAVKSIESLTLPTRQEWISIISQADADWTHEPRHRDAYLYEVTADAILARLVAK